MISQLRGESPTVPIEGAMPLQLEVLMNRMDV